MEPMGRYSSLKDLLVILVSHRHLEGFGFELIRV